MPGTLPFSANEVQNYPGTTPDTLSGDMTVLMKTNKYYTDGSLKQTGSSYTVTKAWGRIAVERGWASDVDSALPVQDTPSTGLFTATELTNLLALAEAYSIQPATWYNGEISSVVTPSITANGNLTTSTDQVPRWWLIVLNAQDDVEAAQRLLDGGPNVLIALPGQALQPPMEDYLGETEVITTAHAVCISTATVAPADYVGGTYILSGAIDETLANALANMAKFEWSSGLGATTFRAVATPVYSSYSSSLMVAVGV